MLQQKYYILNRYRSQLSYKQLAKYLSVSEQAVKQYPKIKRDLMIQGYWRILEQQEK